MASTFFSFAVVEKAIKRLSGDQKGRRPSSVPESGRASRESSDRTHSKFRPAWPVAKKATRRPSGEMTGFC